MDIGGGTVWADVVAELPVGMLLGDEKGTVLAHNARAEELLGLTANQLRGRTFPTQWRACAENGAELPRPEDIIGQLARTGASTAQAIRVGEAARQTRLWAKYYPVSRAGEPLVLVLLQPVNTDVGRSHGLLDPLTELPNATLALDRLDQALLRARTHGTLVSVVLLDICGMAVVNAELGFARGDDLLTVSGGRLRQGLRADHTVARFGGDAFLVIAEHPHGTGESVAARARELLEKSVRLDGKRVALQVRVGWVTSDGNNPVHSVITHLESRLAH
ncbi:MAG TPA: sensor domain-containing diguanylate cyclase [Pseudonocardiaceae bacterium]|jgi:diguanylate cyclase (GGDEF)-like protein|nr:sensor domain-containing diguanylate cyclase [Pseudonocardiaceae bacterium]